jgi:hypothetical protein
MKTFYEMLGLLENSTGDKLGLGERGAVDFMQLSNGHWAGHVYSGEVFVTKERYSIGQRPDAVASTFKYQPSRKATPEEEEEEYNNRHREFRKTWYNPRYDDPNYEDPNESTCSKNKVVREDSWSDKYKGTAQERRGRLEDWIDANKDFIHVKKGYGECEECVRVYIDVHAEDEARRSGYSSEFDLWGLSHLEDYVLTSRISGNAAVLMPRPRGGLKSIKMRSQEEGGQREIQGQEG